MATYKEMYGISYADLQSFSKELTEALKRSIGWEWAFFLEETVLPRAKERCPRAPKNRESYEVGMGVRKFPLRLSETIYVKRGDENTAAVLASDDPRMGWIEKGTPPHDIVAHPVSEARQIAQKGVDGGDRYGWEPQLMWRTDGGLLMMGIQAVLHPGRGPEPVLNPAIYEAIAEFEPILIQTCIETIEDVAKNYGLA